MVDLFSLQEAKPKNKQPDEREASTIVSHAPVAMSLRVWVMSGGSCHIPLSHFTPAEKMFRDSWGWSAVTALSWGHVLSLSCLDSPSHPLSPTRQSVIPYSYLDLFSVHQHDVSTFSRPALYQYGAFPVGQLHTNGVFPLCEDSFWATVMRFLLSLVFVFLGQVFLWAVWRMSM